MVVNLKERLHRERERKRRKRISGGRDTSTEGRTLRVINILW